MVYTTFGCLMPMIRPHSDRSSEISHPASSYWPSWWILFVLGCTMIRFTPLVLLPPPSTRRAQWEGVNGALLSHILTVSARIPTTPLPSKLSFLCEWKWMNMLSVSTNQLPETKQFNNQRGWVTHFSSLGPHRWWAESRRQDGEPVTCYSWKWNERLNQVNSVAKKWSQLSFLSYG
jgi:hypothetical protein